MNAAAMYNGFAPLMARSLTVPLIASRPISPPGKKIGVTTKASVVKAIRDPLSCNTAWSSSSRQVIVSKSRQKDFLDQIAGELAAAAVPEDDLFMIENRRRTNGSKKIRWKFSVHQITSSSPMAT